MPQRILIDPVTRIEGHAKITVQLDDAGQVSDAHFHVTEFRGFERMYEGRPLWEMPSITARVCGICPVSHLNVAEMRTFLLLPDTFWENDCKCSAQGLNLVAEIESRLPGTIPPQGIKWGLSRCAGCLQCPPCAAGAFSSPPSCSRG